MLTFGCGKPAAKKGEEKKPPEKAQKNPLIPDHITVNTNAGNATVRSPESHDILYTAKWQGARVTAGAEGVLSGSMEGVEGELYDKKRASTFKADDAVAHRESMKLTLTGHVTITAIDTGPHLGKEPEVKRATLTCDKVEVEWVTDEKKTTASVVKASGNVQVVGAFGTLSGLNEIWATPDLTTVATPSMFKKP